MRVGNHQVDVRAGRERTVLALLLLHANEVVTAPHLIEAVWGERAPRNARNQLQGCVSRLRKQLAEAGIAEPVVVTEPTGYRARVGPRQLDLLEFRRLRDEARAAVAAGRPAAAVDRYRSALGLWRGETLAAVGGEPLRVAAASLDEERVQATEECIRSELALGKAGELISELTQLVQQHPYWERLHSALMLALYRAGRQADALAAYRRLRQRLHDELAAEPAAELQQLNQAILHHDPELVPRPLPAEATAVAAAEEKAAGSAEEEAAAAEAPAAVGAVTPVPAEPTRPRELPADVPAFTGRDHALAALDGMLPDEELTSHGSVIISAIAGTAGVGKTALAIHWAHRVAHRFPDGQLHLNLRGHASGPPLRPVEALATLLRSLGASPAEIPAEEAPAAALYRTRLADRRVLVVLDNAGSAEQVRPLLPGSPDCMALITSRDRLTGLVARDGARRFTLDVLDPAEARLLLTRLLGPARVAAEPEATAALVEACAQLPLALRIAAAGLADRPDTTIDGYVRHLVGSGRLGVLQADGDQESSVLAALDLSYHALPADVARLFRLLGLVPGPDITAWAAAALAGVRLADAERQLRRLAAAHLVEEQVPDRYSFHDLLRLYARRLADRDDPDADRAAAVRRLLTSYLCGADTAAGLLYGEMLQLPLPSVTGRPPPLVELDKAGDALAWLDAEHPNLTAALQYAAGDQPLRPYAWLLADRLRGYFWHRRPAAVWSATASAALSAAQRAGDRTAQAAAQLSLADLHLCTDRYPAAIEHYTQAEELARQAGWIRGQSAALTNLGIVYRVIGELPKAAAHYRQALALHERTSPPVAQASVYTNLGTVQLVLGQLREAAEYCRHALDLYRQAGSTSGEASALRNLAAVSRELGQVEESSAQYAQAVALSQEVGNRSTAAGALAGLARAELDAGRVDAALDHVTASLTLATEIGDRRCEAVAHHVLGDIYLQLRQAERALASQRRALAVSRAVGERFRETEALLGLAAAHHALGEADQATESARQAFDIADATGYRIPAGNALAMLAEIMSTGNGQYRQAREYAERALAIHRETGHRPGEVRAARLLAQPGLRTAKAYPAPAGAE